MNPMAESSAHAHKNSDAVDKPKHPLENNLTPPELSSNNDWHKSLKNDVAKANNDLVSKGVLGDLKIANDAVSQNKTSGHDQNPLSDKAGKSIGYVNPKDGSPNYDGGDKAGNNVGYVNPKDGSPNYDGGDKASNSVGYVNPKDGSSRYDGPDKADNQTVYVNPVNGSHQYNGTASQN